MGHDKPASTNFSNAFGAVVGKDLDGSLISDRQTTPGERAVLTHSQEPDGDTTELGVVRHSSAFLV